jgi:hypothetical protein
MRDRDTGAAGDRAVRELDHLRTVTLLLARYPDTSKRASNFWVRF